MKYAVLLLCLVQDPRPDAWKLTIEAAQASYQPGKPCPVRFVVENPGEREMDLAEPADYLEGLEVTAPDGKVIRAFGDTKDIKRTFRADPGGFLGRTVDISRALDVPEGREGFYRLRWKFGDAESNAVSVLVMRDYVAELETTHGTIKIEFHPRDAPNHVLSFLNLARKGKYDGTKFHRIIPGFMMQGGRLSNPEEMREVALKAEFSARKHVTGTVSMARATDPDSASTEFFVCFAPAPHLDGQYSVFGQVIEGEEVVARIGQVETDHNPCRGCKQELPPRSTPHCGKPGHHNDVPNSDVILKKVTIKIREKK